MKILVIRFLEIGDAVLTSVLCNSLKKSFPDAQVDFLVYQVSAALFENHPYIDNVISISSAERRNPLRYLGKIRQLTNRKYDIIIDATSTTKSGLICCLSPSSTYRIGRLKKGRGFGYTHRVDCAEGNKIDQRLRLLKPLAENGTQIKLDSQMTLAISEQQKSLGRELMRQHGVDFNRPVFIASVGAKHQYKKWRLDYMAEVAEYCLNNFGAQIVLNAGTPAEKTDSLLLHELLGKHPRVFPDIPSNSLSALGALMRNSDFFFGNEGGPRHIAHALGLPTVAICSPYASRAEWVPYDGDRHRAIDWLDVSRVRDTGDIKFEVGDAMFTKLHNSIKPKAVFPLLDEVVRAHVSCVSNSFDKNSFMAVSDAIQASSCI